MTATVAPTVAEARETVPQAIDDAIRDLEIAIRYLQLRKRELEGAANPPFVHVSPAREGKT